MEYSTQYMEVQAPGAEEPEGRAVVSCSLCPHHCRIAPGRSGICGVRGNANGVPDLPYYGHLSAVASDPIEKKPLYHFHPGQWIYSIGFLGCSLRCPFCQNFHISQERGANTRFVSPENLVRNAQESGSFGIAYTYNEPTVHFEYVTEAARLARQAGLKNVLVSAGYLNPEPARRLLDLMDAANIDLKSFSEEMYRRELKAGLAEVLEFLRLAVKRIHLEVTTLVIPGKNDGDQEIEAMAGFLADLSPDIPYHLSAYHPSYRYVAEATRPEAIRRAVELARKHLRFVYPGNIVDDADSVCPNCGAVLVQRRGYRVRLGSLGPTGCRACGQTVPFVLGNT